MSEKQLVLLDSPLTGDVKSEKSIMDFPFFDLSRHGKRREPITYDDGRIFVEVRAGASGMATIYDKDLLLYAASLMWEKLESGETPGREFTFAAHDFMRVAGRDTSSRSYDNISKMVARLQGTQIRTNIEAGGVGEDGFFSWLESARIVYRRNAAGRKVMQAMRITICEWLHRALLSERGLTYHPRYFELPPLQRRIYDIARSYCAESRLWACDLERFRLKVGYAGVLKRFRWELARIAEGSRVPEYRLDLISDRGSSDYRDLEAEGFEFPTIGLTQLQRLIVVLKPVRRAHAVVDRR